jgi:hypothetical protein
VIKNDTFSLEWHAPEHEHKQRSSDWFWALGIITVSIVLVAILFGNIIFGILILVSAFSLALFINKQPEDIQMSINGIGIMKDRTLYPFETLDTFWIDIEHPHKKIILHSKKVLMPLIIIPVADDMNVDALHEQLSKYIKEEYHSLPLVEKILEYLGF